MARQPTGQPLPLEVDAAVTRLTREESGRVLALLAARFDDLDLADEAVQDGLIEAVRTWPERGIPDNPAGWLMTVAYRKGIDRLRRAVAAHRRTLAAARDLHTGSSYQELSAAELSEEEVPPLILDDTPPTAHGDEQLRLMLLCCHPALAREVQVALTLRLVGGLTTAEIAAAFLVPEPAMAQRIVRAKRKIRDARIPLSVPARIEARVGELLDVLYLIFNEGYLSRGGTDVAIRTDLMSDALRLTERLADELPHSAEVLGLLALEMYHAARSSTRLDSGGELVLLEAQDRSRWDLGTVRRADTVLARAMQLRDPGPFQLQAIIAGYHANARTPADTDWPAIVAAYRQLVAMTPSPIIALNLAVATAMADGAPAGLAALDTIGGLDRYHLFHATRGELLLRAGRRDEALVSLRAARDLATGGPEQRHLDRRIAAALS